MKRKMRLRKSMRGSFLRLQPLEDLYIAVKKWALKELFVSLMSISIQKESPSSCMALSFHFTTVNTNGFAFFQRLLVTPQICFVSTLVDSEMRTTKKTVQECLLSGSMVWFSVIVQNVHSKPTLTRIGTLQISMNKTCSYLASTSFSLCLRSVPCLKTKPKIQRENVSKEYF